MIQLKRRLRTLAACSCLGLFALPGHAQVDFGNDSSTWSNDGECDDPRFAGDGMASVLLDEDRLADATDCRTLFEQGRISLAAGSGGGGSMAGGIDFGDDSSTWSNDGECDDPRFEGEGVAQTLLDSDLYADATDCRTLFEQGRITLVAGGGSVAGEAGAAALTPGAVIRGRLESGDGVLQSGEYRDQFNFEGSSGEVAVIDLRSGEFDPYLMVRTPSGEQYDNDDHEGDATRSLVSIPLAESGTYSVSVTSYRAEETGGYTLRLDTDAGSAPSQGLDEQGALQSGDVTLQSGEYMDTFEFTGRPGQRVAIDLRSDEFDTYVILVDPSGGHQENDDAEDGIGHSRIEADLTEAGTYEVIVTSYEPGETGSYRLAIDQGDVAGGLPQSGRDVSTLIVGNAETGSLEDGDQQIETGEFQDLYVFDGDAGQGVRVEMSSSDFDTFVALITPSGDIINNDDYEGSTSMSVVEMQLPESGRYRVAATSYQAGETGAYRLLVNRSSGAAAGSSSAGSRSGSGGRTYGIFAGISDYPGTGNDLDFTAEDAIRVRDALIRGGDMRPEDAVTLTDSNATKANFSRALQEIASAAGPNDTFVFFYSGHGSRVQRSAGPETFDPDALDETLEFYDGALRDDELRAMLEPMRAGTTLLLLDSCFSGGFAKDIISVPGRMGMFSSEEDVTSQVAVKFRAGGYLSYFLDEAIGERLADEDRDGQVTAIELSEYVHYRYRNDVKSVNPDDFVRTGGPQSGYQHLVVDRGSISPYDVLFP
jgi:hypothetical protein